MCTDGVIKLGLQIKYQAFVCTDTSSHEAPQEYVADLQPSILVAMKAHRSMYQTYSSPYPCSYGAQQVCTRPTTLYTCSHGVQQVSVQGLQPSTFLAMELSRCVYMAAYNPLYFWPWSSAGVYKVYNPLYL